MKTRLEEILQKLVDLRAKEIATDGDHPEFCDCAWCETWAAAREALKDPGNSCPGCGAPDYRQSMKFERSPDFASGTFFGECGACGKKWSRPAYGEAKS